MRALTAKKFAAVAPEESSIHRLFLVKGEDVRGGIQFSEKSGES